MGFWLLSEQSVVKRYLLFEENNALLIEIYAQFFGFFVFFFFAL
jgi:hypothetical protein